MKEKCQKGQKITGGSLQYFQDELLMNYSRITLISNHHCKNYNKTKKNWTHCYFRKSGQNQIMRTNLGLVKKVMTQ